ncbi:uncharacterized protein STEHIDRAFT_116803 [Stereum hirsutum FP-91666 SS1]|uniref:Uncharacterized protein n=1 Tax=Stereum hirsutum (strain FP-91666) TaxID=721885 RepID=R7RVL3_STEHR|nr:uncharacterized protein STEHIDRAFT_116803 [Stereum hirsutum FP-91666 SS1]EIM79099.1 hypothetical protein STEHIDRAFT_116803 [Stereum hirsutum FP-91666 SS1]
MPRKAATATSGNAARQSPARRNTRGQVKSDKDKDNKKGVGKDDIQESTNKKFAKRKHTSDNEDNEDVDKATDQTPPPSSPPGISPPSTPSPSKKLKGSGKSTLEGVIIESPSKSPRKKPVRFETPPPLEVQVPKTPRSSAKKRNIETPSSGNHNKRISKYSVDAMDVDDDNPFMSKDISQQKGYTKGSASQLSNQQLREKQAALARLIKEIEAQIGDTGDQGQSESYSDEENNMTVDGYEKDDFVVDDEAEDEDDAADEEGAEDEDAQEDNGQQEGTHGEEEEEEEEEEPEQPKRLKTSKASSSRIADNGNDTDPGELSSDSIQRRKKIAQGKKKAADPEVEKDGAGSIQVHGFPKKSGVNVKDTRKYNMSICSVTSCTLQHKLVQASFRNVPPYPEAGGITGSTSTIDLDFLDDSSFTGIQIPALVQLLTFTQAGRFHNPAYANPDDFSTAFGVSTNPTIHIPDTIIPSLFISFGIVHQSNTIKGRAIGANSTKGYKDIQIYHISQYHERAIAFMCRTLGESELSLYTYEGAVGYSTMFGELGEQLYYLLLEIKLTYSQLIHSVTDSSLSDQEEEQCWPLLTLQAQSP